MVRGHCTIATAGLPSRILVSTVTTLPYSLLPSLSIESEQHASTAPSRDGAQFVPSDVGDEALVADLSYDCKHAGKIIIRTFRDA